jgi:diaminohydroxyphosphoribosylaminopyrimidine deaminase/5-amino-6-(5-phosphoribosylamino)uracil reductase
MDEVSSQHIDSMMALAISEARKGAGFVSPNPQVGCVIVSPAGEILATGYHHKYGGSHAEVDALQKLKPEQLQGARVFVTLEPCAHEGKTPSCAKALARFPLSEVIYGLVDPNPLVSGQGAEILEKAGIRTQLYQGPLTKDLEEVCEHFLVNFREKRPFISLKVASSLDGQLGLASGESKWITGPEAREKAHQLRATHEGILIGQGTLETDDPSLDIRHSDYPNKTNKVLILLGSKYEHLRPRQMKVLKSHNEEDVFFLERAEGGYFVLRLGVDGRLSRTSDQPELGLNFTRRAGGPLWISSILIEGGAEVLSSHIDPLRADRLYVFQAPILLGAKGGKAWTGQVILKSMGDRVTLKHQRVQPVGSDMLITGLLETKNMSLGSEAKKSVETAIALENSQMKWVRSKNGWLAGVCQGLGERFGIEVWILRACLLIAIFWFGTGLLAYFLMAICLPREDRIEFAFHKRVLGVCAGISRRNDFEVGLVRLLTVFLALSSMGLACFAYIVFYLVMPKNERIDSDFNSGARRS